MHESLHDTLTRYSWWNGGNVSNWKTAIAVPLPAQRAALSLLPYNKGAIFMGSGVLLAHRRWNQATPSQLERNGTLWNGTVSLRGRKGGHRSLPNNGDQLPFDLHWHQSTIFEQMKKMKNFERRATNQQLSIWTCFMQAYIRVDVFPNMGGQKKMGGQGSRVINLRCNCAFTYLYCTLGHFEH